CEQRRCWSGVLGSFLTQQVCQIFTHFTCEKNSESFIEEMWVGETCLVHTHHRLKMLQKERTTKNVLGFAINRVHNTHSNFHNNRVRTVHWHIHARRWRKLWFHQGFSNRSSPDRERHIHHDFGLARDGV